MKLNLEEALKIALDAECTPEQWRAAERTILARGLCPTCAQDGFRQRLGRQEEATADTYAGRECPSCEEFFPTPGQRAEPREPDYGGALGADGCVYSDALPGF